MLFMTSLLLTRKKKVLGKEEEKREKKVMYEKNEKNYIQYLLFLSTNLVLVFKQRSTSPSSVSSFFTICPETWDSRRWVFLKISFCNNKNFETLFLIINILYGILSSCIQVYIKVERLKVSNSTPLRRRFKAKWRVRQKIICFLIFLLFFVIPTMKILKMSDLIYFLK